MNWGIDLHFSFTVACKVGKRLYGEHRYCSMIKTIGNSWRLLQYSTLQLTCQRWLLFPCFAAMMVRLMGEALQPIWSAWRQLLQYSALQLNSQRRPSTLVFQSWRWGWIMRNNRLDFVDVPYIGNYCPNIIVSVLTWIHLNVSNDILAFAQGSLDWNFC